MGFVIGVGAEATQALKYFGHGAWALCVANAPEAASPTKYTFFSPIKPHSSMPPRRDSSRVVILIQARRKGRPVFIEGQLAIPALAFEALAQD